MQTVIIDLSAIFHATIHGLFGKGDWTVGPDGKKIIDPKLLKAGIIGSILYYKNMKGKPDEVIVAVDAPPYWRRDILPFYKGLRKSHREESDIDYKAIFPVLDELISEINENLPWHVIKVDRLEADDVIGILAPRCSTVGKVRIISADGDLVQLQRYSNIEQYSPITKKLVKPKDSAILDLYNKIIKGDGGDGIPNIYMSDNFYKDKQDGGTTRQKPVKATLINEALKVNFDPKKFCTSDEMIANFERNCMLVDFTRIPQEYVNQVIEAYSNKQPTGIMKLQQYLATNRFTQLLDSIREF